MMRASHLVICEGLLLAAEAESASRFRDRDAERLEVDMQRDLSGVGRFFIGIVSLPLRSACVMISP